MSEYQYYEFLALDRPLTAKQRAELRSISSRAEITATRFTNEYQWGDLKGDPLQMVKEYFDAFLYLANWGTRDDEETEPPVPPGLRNLSAGLQAVVDFFEIDENLIAVAAASSPAIEEPGGLAEWIASLAAEEKDSLLARVAGGEGAQVQALLLRRFRAASGSSAAAAPGRTAAELREAAEDRRAARDKAAEQRRRKAEARKAAAEAAAYAKRLDQLATRTEEAWREMAELIETKKPREYDQAVSLLRDLQALAEREGGSAEFRQRFGELRVRHDRKPSLQERFDKAGLPS